MILSILTLAFCGSHEAGCCGFSPSTAVRPQSVVAIFQASLIPNTGKVPQRMVPHIYIWKNKGKCQLCILLLMMEGLSFWCQDDFFKLKEKWPVWVSIVQSLFDNWFCSFNGVINRLNFLFGIYINIIYFCIIWIS